MFNWFQNPVISMNMGQNSPPRALRAAELIEYVGLEGSDFSIGSRMMLRSDAKRLFSRVVLCKCFNFLVRIFFRSKLYGHQCGFKALKCVSLFELLDLVEGEHWFWDTEFLVFLSLRFFDVFGVCVFCVWILECAECLRINRRCTRMDADTLRVGFG